MNRLVRSRRAKIGTKTKVPKLVSVKAMRSGRAVYTASCGFAYQQFSRSTPVVRPCVVLSSIATAV